MRKQRVIILAPAFVAALGLIWWTAANRPPPVRDPVYQGYPVSYWVHLPLSAANASTHPPIPWPLLNSNSLPYLLQALKERDGPLLGAYLRLRPHFPGWLTHRVSIAFPQGWLMPYDLGDTT